MRAARRLLLLPTLLLLTISCIAVAAPVPQDAHWWDSAIDSLAAKIAGDLKPRAAISLTVKNLSSLDSAAVAGIRATLEINLQHRGFSLSRSTAPGAAVDVTLSENMQDYVWAAVIRRGDEEQVAIVSVARSAAAPAATSEPAISLQRQIIWQQPGEILDFAVIAGDANGAIALVILEPERLVFYKSVAAQLQLDRTVTIAHAKPWPRDVRGKIDFEAQSAALPGVQCGGSFDHPETIQCSETALDKAGLAQLNGTTIQLSGRDVEAVTLGSVCGVNSLLLASGTGDWTQPDSIRAYTSADQQPAALGKPLDYAGPVLVLWPSSDRQSARVISRNLLTGTYEASIVSVSCNR
jgi:hypothetical protein